MKYLVFGEWDSFLNVYAMNDKNYKKSFYQMSKLKCFKIRNKITNVICKICQLTR